MNWSIFRLSYWKGKNISNFFSFFLILNILLTFPISIVTIVILNSYYESLLENNQDALFIRSKALSANLENSIKDRVVLDTKAEEFLRKTEKKIPPIDDFDSIEISWENDKPVFVYTKSMGRFAENWYYNAEFITDKILDSELVLPDETVLIMNFHNSKGISDSIENGFKITEKIQDFLNQSQSNNLYSMLKEHGIGQIIVASNMPSLPFRVIIIKPKSIIYTAVRMSLLKFVIGFSVVFFFITGMSIYISRILSERRKEESKLRSLMQNLPLGVSLMDQNLDTIIQNQIMEEIQEEDHDLWDRIKREAQFRIRSTDKPNSNYVWETQNDKNWEITLSPWFDDSDTPPEGYSILLRDLTAKKLIFEHEMEMARKIQEEYLPNDEEVFDGIRFKVFYKPYLQVGGDYYDFIQLDNNKCLFVMADVIGHGLQAAMMMTVVKVIFLQIASTVSDPAEILHELNIAFKNSLPVGKSLVPLHFLILDTEKKEFQYGNGGHPGMMFFPDSHNEEHETFERINPVLGFFEGWKPEIIQGKYSQNSKFFLFTDGLPDINGKDEILGYEKIKEFTGKYRRLGPEEFSSRLEEFIHNYSEGQSFPDDITWFVIDSL